MEYFIAPVPTAALMACFVPMRTVKIANGRFGSPSGRSGTLADCCLQNAMAESGSGKTFAWATSLLNTQVDIFSRSPMLTLYLFA